MGKRPYWTLEGNITHCKLVNRFKYSVSCFSPIPEKFLARNAPFYVKTMKFHEAVLKSEIILGAFVISIDPLHFT